MRSAQIKGGGERRNENSLRPQGRPNPIIPITPANHTLMMGIKMCWPRSSPARQPSAAECVWIPAVAAGKDKSWRSALICAVRHSSLGVFRSALCGEKGSQQNYTAFSFVTACGTFCASSWKQGERPMIHPKLLSMLRKEQFNPLKLPPWPPSESPFPRKHTDIVQMYPNWRSIQKRRVV